MKNFYQYIAPFAPDYSGASSVLYEAGGMIVICDPGGCSGIVCGYDEPRFYGGNTPLYSAALRELDTILGRDDRLVTKIVHGAQIEKDLRFLALLGGPVVSVIGTDLEAVARKAEAALHIPAFGVATTGMRFYDVGEGKAYQALFRKFLPREPRPSVAEEEQTTLVLGAIPLELPGKFDLSALRTTAKSAYGKRTAFLGGTETVELLSHPEKIGRTVALSVPGLRAAKELQEQCGVPFTVDFPGNPEFDRLREQVATCPQRLGKVLLLHQQICANALRRELRALCGTISVASFFQMEEALMEDGDRFLPGEDELIQLIREGGFDCVLCDPFYLPAIEADGAFSGKTLPFTQPAVSGDYYL